MAITVDTLNAMTQKFWIEKTMQELVFRDTPVLNYLQKYMRAAGGTACQFPVEYARLGGGSRAKGGQMTLTTPEIATKGELGWRYYYVPVELYQEDIDINESDPTKVASYLNRYVKSALATMREMHLGQDIFKAQTSNALDSIVDAVSDSASYAGLLKADIKQWRCVVGEGTYSPTTEPVSPSLGNFRRMIRAIQRVCGEKPQLIVTSSAVYDKLSDQLDANDNISATRAGNDVVKWGFDTFFISGVPVVDDMSFEENVCEDWVDGGDSRTTCKGHQALFLNFKHLYPYYIPGRNITWDKHGWVSPIDYTKWVNKLHFWGNIICTDRRTQGRLYSIDPAQDEADFTAVDIDLADFAPYTGS